jgi:hypothetical protein
MQVGERLDNHTISLLEPLRAFRFCPAVPAPHAKPRHGTFFPISSAPHQSAASGELSRKRCKKPSQMTEMPDDGRA